MLELLKAEANLTKTQNGAVTYRTTFSHNLDLFATVGALRQASDGEVIGRFISAYAEDSDLAMKLLFFARDVRGGLGERRLFRTIMKWLGDNQVTSVKKNIKYIAEFGRFDDILCLLGTRCESEAVAYIGEELDRDIRVLESGGEVSLLGKWLPSANASNKETVAAGKRLARLLGYSPREWRKTLTALRQKIRIIENDLRERDYSFDYEKLPSRALLKYRAAFERNDGERYSNYLSRVADGSAKMNTGTLTPYDIVGCCIGREVSEQERASLDAAWKNLENFVSSENSIAVVDGSGSMYCGGAPLPAAVAMSLGIYFAENNKGGFGGHFITFSETPRLIEIKGEDIYEKVRYCMQYNECANTDIEKIFELILRTAVKNRLSQAEMPQKIYIISDMEFDACSRNASLSNFENAKMMFEEAGYSLPVVVFWNVNSRTRQQPVSANEQGAVLVSGSSPRVFSMLKSGDFEPLAFMNSVLRSERYEKISA